jgi:hypothetical protein
MLKTVKTVKDNVFPTWVVMLLAFLILVLCFHFLFEDLSFSPTQNLSSTNYPAQSEITHNDDIVQVTELSSQKTSNPVAHINPVLLTLQLKVFFPQFNPPDI